MGWENLLGQRLCFHLYSPNVRLWKDEFSWQYFKKISRTLFYTNFANFYTTFAYFFLLTPSLQAYYKLLLTIYQHFTTSHQHFTRPANFHATNASSKSIHHFLWCIKLIFITTLFKVTSAANLSSMSINILVSSNLSFPIIILISSNTPFSN